MSKVKILVVEDEGIVAQSIKSILNNLGYDVCDIAMTGKKAVQKAGETQPDLILMDIKLKGDMAGIEAAEKIHGLHDIPVVFLTAYADPETLKRAKVTGPFGYVVKPFEEQDLHSTIEMALYKSKMERKLKEREHWFSTVLQSIGDGVIATDQGGKLTFMNPVAEDLTGWKLKNMLGKIMGNRFNIVNGMDGSSSPKDTGEEKMHEGTIKLWNHSVLISKKREIPIDYSNAPIVDRKGTALGSVLVFHDVTERMNAQKELHQSYTKLQRVLEETIRAMSRIVEVRDPQQVINNVWQTSPVLSQRKWGFLRTRSMEFALRVPSMTSASCTYPQRFSANQRN